MEFNIKSEHLTIEVKTLTIDPRIVTGLDNLIVGPDTEVVFSTAPQISVKSNIENAGMSVSAMMEACLRVNM